MIFVYYKITKTPKIMQFGAVGDLVLAMESKIHREPYFSYPNGTLRKIRYGLCNGHLVSSVAVESLQAGLPLGTKLGRSVANLAVWTSHPFLQQPA